MRSSSSSASEPRPRARTRPRAGRVRRCTASALVARTTTGTPASCASRSAATSATASSTSASVERRRVALERDLGHARARVAPNQRSPHSSTSPPGWDRGDLDVRREPAQRVRRAVEQRERAVVARHAARHAEQLERDGGLARAHREVVADRQHRDVRRVDPADQRHVAEDVRVAGEVDASGRPRARSRAARLAEIRAVVRARRVVARPST